MEYTLGLEKRRDVGSKETEEDPCLEKLLGDQSPSSSNRNSNNTNISYKMPHDIHDELPVSDSDNVNLYLYNNNNNTILNSNGLINGKGKGDDHKSENSEDFYKNEPNYQFKPKKGPQVFAALAACFGSFGLGSVISWTAVALPYLRESENFKDISQTEESWIGSFISLGAMVACPISGILIDKIGRRALMLCLTIPFIAGWLLIGFAINVPMIYAGRFITGYCIGAFSIAAPVYITESTDKNIRGALTTGFDWFQTIGILFIYLVGTFTSWRLQAFISISIPICTHILLSFVPESPRYLIGKGKEEKAIKSLLWLRGAKEKEQISEEIEELTSNADPTGGKKLTLKEFFTKPVLKPLSVGLLLMFFSQASAIDAILFYTVDIFESAGTKIDGSISTVIVGAVQVFASIAPFVVIDRFGRRLLLILSALFMCISLASLGTYFHIKKNNPELASDLTWIPLTSILIYITAFTIGFGPVPWLVTAEILPFHVKGLGTGLVTILRWLLGFVFTLVFYDIMDALGTDGGYWLFSGFCFLGLIYSIFFVPETKGKSLDEIQSLFKNSNNDLINTVPINNYIKTDELQQDSSKTSVTTISDKINEKDKKCVAYF